MDLDNLKTAWRQMGERIGNLECENRRMAERLAAGKATTAQHRLASTAKRSICASAIIPFLAPLISNYLDFPVWVAVAYALFGVIVGVANLMLYNTITRCDYMSLPLVNAIENAVKIRRQLRNTRALGLSLGSIIILSFIYCILSTFETVDNSIIYGILIGFAVGAFIGARKWIEPTRLSNEIIRELRAVIHDHNGDTDIPL